jgi:hypothetical protein
MLSFSGQLLETVSLYRDATVLRRNFAAIRDLFSRLPKPEVDPLRVRGGIRQRWTGFLWSGVQASDVVSFLYAYRTHPEAYKVNSSLLAQFVQSMVSVGELSDWTVALIGGGEGKSLEISDGVRVDMLKRVNNGPGQDRYSIGRLLSPRDEGIDLDEGAWAAALVATREAWRADPARLRDSNEPDAPNGPAIRKIRGFGAQGVPPHPERGLLLLYALDPEKAEVGFTPHTPPIIAMAVSFPGSNSGLKVEYKVNNILWEQEYGPAE